MEYMERMMDNLIEAGLRDEAWANKTEEVRGVLISRLLELELINRGLTCQEVVESDDYEEKERDACCVRYRYDLLRGNPEIRISYVPRVDRISMGAKLVVEIEI